MDFYFEKKRKSFNFFSLAWSIWFLSGMVLIIIDNLDDSIVILILLNLYGLSISISISLFILGFLSYFLKIKTKHLVMPFILISLPALFLILLANYYATVSYFIFISGIILISGLLIPVFNYTRFKIRFGGSIKWYFLLATLTVVQIVISLIMGFMDYEFSLQQVEVIPYEIVDYLLTIINTILLLILVIHLEYNITNEEKYAIIDKYSHNLGNIIQTFYSACQLRVLRNLPEEKINELKNLQYEKLEEARKLIDEIKKLDSI
ncbi:MAG: hypothetical protein R6U19_10150 [Bacteroidales bacterium]